MIKVGFCVAYDWYFLKNAIPLIYPWADTICLSIDKDRKSWVGNAFDFDEKGFADMLSSLDVDKKIKLLEEDFHLPELSPMQNEVRQRNRMAEFMGKGGWHIQVDADEYFIDFAGFVRYLNSLTVSRRVNVWCPGIVLYKKIDEGYLMVQPQRFEQIEYIPVATNFPVYEYGRRNGSFNLYAAFTVLHQSWARTPEEVWQKLTNWGHRFDSDIEEHFAIWKKASKSNYTEYRNFNQVHPDSWPKLELIELADDDVKSLIASEIKLPFRLTQSSFLFKNSIWVSRCKKVLLVIQKVFSRNKSH